MLYKNITTLYFNNCCPKTSLLAVAITDVVLEDLALKVLSLGKLAKLCLLRLIALHLLNVKE